MTSHPQARLWLVLLLVLACLAVASRVEGHSLDPNTLCRWDEIRDAQGVCR